MNDDELLQRAARSLVRSGRLNTGRWETSVLYVYRKDGYKNSWYAALNDIKKENSRGSATIEEWSAGTGYKRPILSFDYVSSSGISDDEGASIANALVYAVGAMLQTPGWELVTLFDKGRKALMRYWVES